MGRAGTRAHLNPRDGLNNPPLHTLHNPAVQAPVNKHPDDLPLYDRNAPGLPLCDAVLIPCGTYDARRRVIRDSGVIALVPGPIRQPSIGNTVFQTVVVPVWAAYPLMDWCPANAVPAPRSAARQLLLRISSDRLLRLLRAFAADPQAAATYSTLRRIDHTAAIAWVNDCAPKAPPRKHRPR